jgi:hypothetical protein
LGATSSSMSSRWCTTWICSGRSTAPCRLHMTDLYLDGLDDVEWCKWTSRVIMLYYVVSSDDVSCMWCLRADMKKLFVSQFIFSDQPAILLLPPRRHWPRPRRRQSSLSTQRWRHIHADAPPSTSPNLAWKIESCGRRRPLSAAWRPSPRACQRYEPYFFPISKSILIPYRICTGFHR